MTKNILLRATVLTLAVVSTTLMWANPITESQAQAIASQFMTGKTLQSVNLQRGQHAPRLGAYYVFNAEASTGFVIVAGNDRLPAILGYSDTGTFDATDVPPAMQELLDYYAEQANNPSAQPPQRVSRTPVAPLLKSIWGQGNPFNYYLPFTRTTTSNGVTTAHHAVTGCVATAMAQVMYYHKWPSKTTRTIPAYTSESESDDLTFYRPALGITTFAWSSMKNAYQYGDTANASGQAVAKLMQYCDQSLEMVFGKNSSSALTNHIPYALTTYFNYDASIHYVNRESYTTADWENLLYNELRANRPVVYRGTKNPGGHAFVCDGCDASGLFHINWGWNSLSNGYFLLSDLNPDAQGIGGSDGECGYIYGQAMVIGIKPQANSTDQLIIRFYGMDYQSGTTLTRSSSSADFSFSIYGRFLNASNVAKTFDYGFGLFQGSTMLSTLYTKSYSNELDPNWYIHNTWTVNFGKNMTSGTYYIRAIYSESGKNQWKLCEGASANYIQVVINNNSCSMTVFGSGATPNYTASSMTFSGTKHTGKQLDVTANITNKGNTQGDMIYLFVDGVKTTSGMADMAKNASANVTFHFTPTTAGTKTVKLSLSEDGSNPLITKTVSITAMPAATLTVTNTVLNATNNVINSNKFSVNSVIKNTGASTYNEDVTLRLYRVVNGNRGSNVQDVTIPVTIAAGASKTVQFDCENVIDGENYFAWVYYFSSGTQVQSSGTYSYTMQFPTSTLTTGDINGDGEVDISDVNIIINIMLGKAQASSYPGNANVNGQGGIDIADINAVINIMLGK